MKFGKRLASEAARCWRPFYFDYKAAKRSIREDSEVLNDSSGQCFNAVIAREMQKISSFYVKKVDELDAEFDARSGQWDPDELAKYIAEMQALKKYATLNYIAVYKAVKKRNRRLQECFPGTAITLIDAGMLLREQRFFTSNHLASLFTRAQVLLASFTFSAANQGSALVEEYSCPICLGVLHNPVVLTCAHRFCWGCIVTDCATRTTPTPSTSCGKHGQEHEAVGISGSKQSTNQALSDQLLHYVATSEFESLQPYECACCRRVQFLDLNNLLVDQHLTQFVNGLKMVSGSTSSVSTSRTNITQTAGDGRTAANKALALNVDEEMPDALLAPSMVKGKTINVQSHEHESNMRVIPSNARLRVTAAPFVPKLQPHVIAPTRPEVAGMPTNPITPESLPSEAPRTTPKFLLPPPAPEDTHKMTVILDMDGTLLSSYSATRRPHLPHGLNTFITGRGGKLNPGGVLVVERPGLHKFLRDLSSFAEVVLFTAGIPDYANPIIDHIDPDGTLFRARLFRDATTSSHHYSCVKDMALLGRDLSRTVLVDDTPLAFLNQPNNGIPIFAFRSDPDDRFLCEAVLPLLQSISQEEDVRPVIAKRFDMVKWFRSNGFHTPEHRLDRGSANASKEAHGKLVTTAQRSTAPSANMRAIPPCGASRGKRSVPETLLLMDFDKTLTIADAGEALIGTLAPELLPLLDGLEMPASFVSVTNNILGEMQRRGISRDSLVATLRDLGQRIIPTESQRLIRLATRRGTDVRILSDCNTVFISHMLSGAGVRSLVKEVITNPSAFERVGAALPQDDGDDMPQARNCGASHRLVISPRHGKETGYAHGCPMCPHNLCKGLELDNLRQDLGYKKVVYCGDGANDICPVLRLLEGDVACVRRGHSLEHLVRNRRDEIKAQVMFWEGHQELLSLTHNVLPGRASATTRDGFSIMLSASTHPHH